MIVRPDQAFAPNKQPHPDETLTNGLTAEKRPRFTERDASRITMLPWETEGAAFLL